MGYPGGVIGQAWRLAELRREPLQARSDLAIALL